MVSENGGVYTIGRRVHGGDKTLSAPHTWQKLEHIAWEERFAPHEGIRTYWHSSSRDHGIHVMGQYTCSAESQGNSLTIKMLHAPHASRDSHTLQGNLTWLWHELYAHTPGVSVTKCMILMTHYISSQSCGENIPYISYTIAIGPNYNHAYGGN